MKRCPECRKDYLDDSLLYCLDDGTPLVQGSVTDEPATAILSGLEVPPLGGPSSEDATQRLKAEDTAVQKAKITSLVATLFSRERLPWIVAGLLALTLIAFGAWRLLTPTPASPPFVALDVTAPPGWTTNLTSALSPDGSRLAFTAEHPQEKTRLWVRAYLQVGRWRQRLRHEREPSMQYACITFVSAPARRRVGFGSPLATR